MRLTLYDHDRAIAGDSLQLATLPSAVAAPPPPAAPVGDADRAIPLTETEAPAIAVHEVQPRIPGESGQGLADEL